MASKLDAARLATTAGENVIIASGRTPDVLRQDHRRRARSARSFSPKARPSPRANAGSASPSSPAATWCSTPARAGRSSDGGRSLLPIGVVDVVGRFSKGDVVGLRDADGIEFARGLTNYSADDIQQDQGPEDRRDRRRPRLPSLRRSRPPRQHGGDEMIRRQCSGSVRNATASGCDFHFPPPPCFLPLSFARRDVPQTVAAVRYRSAKAAINRRTPKSPRKGQGKAPPRLHHIKPVMPPHMSKAMPPGSEHMPRGTRW